MQVVLELRIHSRDIEPVPYGIHRRKLPKFASLGFESIPKPYEYLFARQLCDRGAVRVRNAKAAFDEVDDEHVLSQLLLLSLYIFSSMS